VALDLGSNDVAANRLLAAKENLANELRLLYVATTRAKHQCTVVHGRLGSPGHPQGQKEITGISWLLHPQAGMEIDPANPDAGIAHLTPEMIQTDIQPLVEKSGGTISTELLPDSKPARWENSSASSETLKALEFEGDTRAQESIHAFSYWASGAYGFHDQHEQPDRDADTDEPMEVAEPKGIHKFPAGNVAGLCLHGIMENLDFPQAMAGAAVQMEIVDRHLERCGYTDHAAVFKANLTDMLRTPLRAGEDFKLADLQQKDRLVELDFTHRLKKVEPGELRDIFERNQSDVWPETLPSRLGRLNFNPLRGYMRGAIDLVFRHGKRFYILDWKSNKLGNDTSAYSADRLPAAMAHRLYYLQYHIYTVALDAYLRQRTDAYDYSRDFGGVFYVFNRGIDPVKPGQGVFYDLPNPELIADLSKAFGLR
jgi:exodeoxyribonuclease V beta subunit